MFFFGSSTSSALLHVYRLILGSANFHACYVHPQNCTSLQISNAFWQLSNSDTDEAHVLQGKIDQVSRSQRKLNSSFVIACCQGCGLWHCDVSIIFCKEFSLLLQVWIFLTSYINSSRSVATKVLYNRKHN